MDVNQLSSLVSRSFTGIAFLLLGVAAVGKTLQMTGSRSELDFISQPRSLLEWAVILLVFVIALLLRQIREGITSSPGS